MLAVRAGSGSGPSADRPSQIDVSPYAPNEKSLKGSRTFSRNPAGDEETTAHSLAAADKKNFFHLLKSLALSIIILWSLVFP
jgi:hypothetical protein